MGDLIHLPGRESGKPPTKAELDARASQTEASRAEQIRRLRKALGGQPNRKLPSADRIAIGQALYKLLDRLEKAHHVPKATVMRDAGIGAEGDSTKHLSYYAIREDGNPARLRKKVAPYTKLARAAAKRAQEDEGQVLWEVFGHANFWYLPGTPEPATEFEALAERLCFIMEGVAWKHKLTNFFREVERAGVAPLPGSDQATATEFGPWPQQWPIEFKQPSWEAETEAGERLPAYPSVVLGSWRLGDPFPVRVTAEIKDADGNNRAVSGVVQGRYSVEMRLCIAPIGKAREATPALRVHLGATLSRLFDSAAPQPEPAPVLAQEPSIRLPRS